MKSAIFALELHSKIRIINCNVHLSRVNGALQERLKNKLPWNLALRNTFSILKYAFHVLICLHSSYPFLFKRGPKWHKESSGVLKSCLEEQSLMSDRFDPLLCTQTRSQSTKGSPQTPYEFWSHKYFFEGLILIVGFLCIQCCFSTWSN